MVSRFRGLSGRLGSGRFLRGVAVISGGSLIAQALPVLLTPVLTRLYAPAEMGVLALYLAFVSFLAGIMTLGYAQAIVSARDDDEAAHLAVLAALFTVPVATVASLVLWALTTQDVVGFGELPGAAVPAMFISLVLTDVFLTLRYWLIRQGAYADISRAVIAQSAGRMVTQVGTGFVRASWGGLVLGEIAGRGFGMRRMWLASFRQIRDRALPMNRSTLRTVASKYRKFPVYTMPSTMIDNLALVLPVPLVTTWFGVQAAGQYSIATRVLVVPLVLVGASVADVFHNRIAQHARETPDRARPFFLLVSGGLFLLGLLPMVVVALFGERLFPFVLGDVWSTSGAIAAAIAPWALAQLTVSPVSRVVLVYEGQEYKLVYDVLSLTTVIGAFWIGGSRDWSLIETVRLLAWAQTALYVVYFLLLLAILRRSER